MISVGGAEHPLDRLVATPRVWLLGGAAALIGSVAWLDWYLGEAVSMGALYVLPVLILSGVVSRIQLWFVIMACAALRLHFNPPAGVAEGAMNAAFAILAYGLIGTFAAELQKNRRRILEQLSEIQRQQRLRRKAEDELRLLAESSPAAVFTLNENAEIVSANTATRELLGLERSASLIGMSVGKNLPVLAEALKLDTGTTGFRTVAQVQGVRRDGTLFLAQACFSTYKAEDGAARLAAIAFDSTEDTREMEEQSQHHMLESNRIIAGAVAHEVRNVCSAMSVVHSNLDKIGGVSGNMDYLALGTLITGLGELACLELHGAEEKQGNSADVRDVLNHLRILIDPAWKDEGAQLIWPELRQPLLAASDSFTLLQAFLNIVNNSLSAVSSMELRRLTIHIETPGPLIHISFSDTGKGVTNPDRLFQPFRTDSGSVGLGLYISRARLRRYGGDVRYQPALTGARFIVEVPLHGVSTDAATSSKHHPAFAGR